jgi:acetyltransferase-like isoleucine patch superfamily enzyme
MKHFLKYCRQFYIALISVIALPLALIFICFGWIAIVTRAYTEVSILASRIPFMFGQRVRYYYYKATLKSLGSNVVFKYGTYCQYPNAIIGNRILFGYFNTIGEVHTGDDIVIGGYVNFLSGTSQHSFQNRNEKIINQKGFGRKMITIGSDVWIGSNSIIASDVGERCVIGAGSLLVKPAKSFGVYGGNPAKLLKNIN